MSDWLAQTGSAFLASLDRLLQPDIPFSLIACDPDTLAVSELASDLACQRSNVLIDPTLPLLCLWDCADCWLRWLADPLNDQRQLELMNARNDVDDACGV
jgi:hypothetical protein